MEITVWQAQGSPGPQGESRASVTVMQPHGRLDALTYRELIERARDVVAAGARYILVDLSDVSYLSSAGLAALHTIVLLMRGEEPPEEGWEAMRAMGREGGLGLAQQVKLLSPQRDVSKVLEMAGIGEFMEIHTDLATAVASF
jgi:hypothetical protein